MFEKKIRPERVIQFGEGGFLRGFADWILQKLNDKTDFCGNAVVVQPIEKGLCDLLSSQNCVYTHLIRGAEGRGESVAAALENMRASTPGYIFLETADYLIIQRGSQALLQQAYTVLRPSCMVCMAEEIPDMQNVARFLEIHESSVTLRENRVEKGRLPLLKERNGRFEWSAE